METETFTNLNRAKTLLSILEDEYSIFDTQNPSDKNRREYAEHCGEIYALIESVKCCMDKVTL